MTDQPRGSAATAKVLDATYLEVIDLALTFPVGDYRDGIVRGAQHILAKANDCYREAAHV